MSDVITIAEAVVKHLADHGAELQFAPEFELSELDTGRCVVVPTFFEQTNVSRNQVTDQFRVEVGIMRRGKELDVASLLKKMKELCRRFTRFNVGNAVCFKVENAPLYDAELLRQRNQFTSVLTLHFKESGNV